MASRKLIVEIVGDSRSVEKAFKRSEKAANGFGTKMKHVGIGLAAVLGTAAVAGAGFSVAFGVKATKAAMSLVESIRRVNAVFGQSAGAVREWGAHAARNLGLTEDKALEGAGAIGLLLRNMGYTPKAAAEMSKRMVQAAVDTAVFNKASSDDTLKAYQRGLTGMMRGLKQYGIVISNADVKAEALRETHKKSAKDLTNLELTQARANLILRQGAISSGAFRRQSGRLSTVFKIIGAETHNLTEQFGLGLLPVVRRVANALDQKLADPRVRAFVRHLGYEVGTVLYKAFTNFGNWFYKNWPAIKAGFRGAARLVNRIYDAIAKTIDLVKGNWKWLKWATGFEFAKDAGKVAGAIGGWFSGHDHKPTGRGGVTVHGDVHVHGVQDPKKFSDALGRHAKNRAGQTRGRHGGSKLLMN